AASVACLLLAAINAYIASRAWTTGKIRSRSATHSRAEDKFSFYATLGLHLAFACASAYISVFFLVRAL
ncbi:MAG: hypothetical protein CFE26_27280, partial [Verrucomicrobiales bacterium VVV1]